MDFRWRRFLLQRKKARKASARTATGTATAGAIVEALELELDFEDAEVVEEGVDAGAAMMLGEEVVRVEEAPLDWVIIDVTRIMLVESLGVLLFWSTEVVVLVGAFEVAVSEEDVDVIEEAVGAFVTTEVAESETVGFSVVVVGGVEVPGVGVVKVEMTNDIGELTGDTSALEGPLPMDENTTPLLSEKRALEVLQQPLLLSPSASGRLASQQ